MKVADAERQVVAEWYRWSASHLPKDRNPKGTDGLSFFAYLQTNCRDLLDFRCSGDKWQTVHGWLLLRRLVSD